MDANRTENSKNDKLTPKPGEKFPSRPTLDEFYNVNYPSKGLMIIFNQHKFINDSPRSGTVKDVLNLRKTFSRIGYTIRDYTDLRTDEIKSTLFEVAQEDHNDHMSLIIVMLTHGTKGDTLHTYDSTINVEELWGPFKANECETLAGKPKLLFIQACKGDGVDSGTLVEPPDCLHSRVVMPTSNMEKYVIPNVADFLIFFSTTEGYVSFRDIDTGSCFVKTLCEKFTELLKDGQEVELIKILQAVQREIAYGFQSNITVKGYEQYNACKQMPMLTSTLTKGLNFKQDDV